MSRTESGSFTGTPDWSWMEGLTVTIEDSLVGTVQKVVEEPQGKPYCEQRRVFVELEDDGHVVNVAEERVSIGSDGETNA